MSPHYIYLVSDGLCIRAVREKPDDVTVVNGRWFVRTIDYALGQALTVYTDDIWKGTVGVYDENDPDQLIQAFDDMGAHTLNILGKRAEPIICRIMGEEATNEFWTRRVAPPRPGTAKPHERGDLLWSIIEAINRLCHK